MSLDRYDVVVVGAGATGSATAWLLARAGRTVLLLDDAPTAQPEAEPSAVVRLGHPEHALTRLALLAHQWWQILARESGADLVEWTGYVEHGPVEALRPLVESLLVSDVPFEYLTGPEAQVRWPWMLFDDRAVVQPVAGVLDVGRTLAVLHEQAVLRGAEVRRGVRATSVERLPEGVLVCGRQAASGAPATFEAAAVVLAAGGATAALASPWASVLDTRTITEHRQGVRHVGTLPGVPGPAFAHRVDPAAHRAARGHLGPDDGYPSAGARGHRVGDGVVVHRSAARADLDEYLATWLPGVAPVGGAHPVTRGEGPIVLDAVGPVVVGVGLGAAGAGLAPGAAHVLAGLAEESLDGVPRLLGADTVDRAAFALTPLVEVG